MGVPAQKRNILLRSVYPWFSCIFQSSHHLRKETEGTALQNDETRYYKDLCGRLDLVLVFTELSENYVARLYVI
jgi:hypothetical protein